MQRLFKRKNKDNDQGLLVKLLEKKLNANGVWIESVKKTININIPYQGHKADEGISINARISDAVSALGVKGLVVREIRDSMVCTRNIITVDVSERKNLIAKLQTLPDPVIESRDCVVFYA